MGFVYIVHESTTVYTHTVDLEIFVVGKNISTSLFLPTTKISKSTVYTHTVDLEIFVVGKNNEVEIFSWFAFTT